MLRKPSVAGQFYPDSPLKLKAMISSFTGITTGKTDAIGLLVPHAGYQYSGPVAAAAVSKIKLTDTVIIMGPSHTGMGEPFSIMTEGTWQTPLGDAEIDSELAGQIAAISKYLKNDQMAHLIEHAIEVQIPLLQYFKPDVRIVPMVLAYAEASIYTEIGKEIASAIKQSQKPVVIMASGDMTHYEPQAVAEEKDSQAIEAILNLDADELTRRYKEMDISMCAYGPVVTLISAARELGATGAELVKYQTSGDTTGDYSAVVGYAGIIIRS
jgi:AmmeMemoRadiSam system protein B